MGDVDGAAPTELAATETETASVRAWGLDDDEDEPPITKFTPGRITGAAVAASLIAIAAASLMAWQLRADTVAPEAATSSMVPATMTTAVPVAAPLPAPPPPPAVTITTVIKQVTPPPTLEMSPDHPGISVQEMAAYDRRFVADLRARGLSVWDRELAITRGHQVCTYLYGGESVVQVKNRLLVEAQNDGGDVYMTANQFVDSAMSTYPDCP